MPTRKPKSLRRKQFRHNAKEHRRSIHPNNPGATTKREARVQ